MYIFACIYLLEYEGLLKWTVGQINLALSDLYCICGCSTLQRNCGILDKLLHLSYVNVHRFLLLTLVLILSEDELKPDREGKKYSDEI